VGYDGNVAQIHAGFLGGKKFAGHNGPACGFTYNSPSAGGNVLGLAC